jgi:hypothetical protein
VRVAARDVGTLAPRLAQTTFDDDYATRYAAQQARRDGTARPSLADLAPPLPADAADRDVITLGATPAPTTPAAASVPAAAPANPAPAPAHPESRAGASEWRLVLAGSAERKQAEARAQQLRARNWNVDGVLANHYPTREAASVAQAKTHKLADLKDAWIVEVPRQR